MKVIKFPIVQEGIKFRLELPAPSDSGIRQPCDVEIRAYCMVLKQMDRTGNENKILLSETQFFELYHKMGEAVKDDFRIRIEKEIQKMDEEE